MSLLEENSEAFTIINKSVMPDGYGGVKTVWTEGATIQGAIAFDDSSATRIAQALGATSVYDFIVKKELQFDFHDVVKRVSDGKVFRITNNADENKTPASASLNMRVYSAEEWSIPS